MGLDMYLRIENTDDPDANYDEIAAWRKHGDLNAWFERLWLKKYKPEQTVRTIRFGDDYFEVSAFNIEKVYLTLPDIQDLFDDLIEDNLPSVEDALSDLKLAWEESQKAEEKFKTILKQFI